MNQKEFKLFLQDEIDLKKKFILLLSKLTINQSDGFYNLMFVILTTYFYLFFKKSRSI